MSTDHPYRLRFIVIDDFKSIRHAEIDLLPLSIIVGANSSGKSTLLQVVLALSQAVRSRSAGATFPLNGEYARFGTFGETVRFAGAQEDSPANDERHIKVRVTLSDIADQDPHRRNKTESEEPSEPLLFLDWHLDLVSDEASAGGTARIDRVHLSGYKQSEDGEPEIQMECRFNDLADMTSEDPDYLILSGRRRVVSRQDLTATREAYVERLEDGELTTWECDSVELRGATPAEVYSLSAFSEAMGHHWWKAARLFVSRLPSEEADTPEDYETIADPAPEDDECLQTMVDSAGKAAQQLHDVWSDRDGSGGWNAPIMYRMQSLLSEQFQKDADNQIRNRIARGLENVAIEDFLNDLTKYLTDEDWAQQLVWNPQEDFNRPSIAWSNFIIHNFFGLSVKYLGPLRKAPQVLYDPRLRDLELGLSGEYTAAILHANSTHQIVPVSSDKPDRVALQAEVNVWLNRFELATEAVLTDRGRLGIGLQVRLLDGGESVDLTSVGVGVSQILPVIVLCLLTEPGDLIILEQPELHLHPALQQQLGDFLLDCAKSGRQLLIETHSEHLINRVRRRVADPSGADEGLVSLVFAEQHNGTTELRQSTIDPYGGSESDWPTGFFDISAAEAQALVSTSLTKRYRGTH